MQTTHTQSFAMRSALYIPGDKERALEKMASLPADTFILDLEDAVAPEKKDLARAQIERVMGSADSAQLNVVVRINGVEASHLEADLLTVARARPRAVLIPKYETRASLEQLRDGLRAKGVSRHTQVWAMIETPLGIADIQTLVDVNAVPDYPLTTLVIGTNDIARLTGTSMGQQRLYMLPWLSLVLIHAKARNMTVLDGVYNDFSDIEGYTAELLQSRAMGFDGKTLIHPSQIAPANLHFSPSEAELAWARKVADAFALPENQGYGAIKVDGGMVELLHLVILWDVVVYALVLHYCTN